MHYWLDRGCPASKLNLGLAAYGRTFTLGNESTSTAIGTDILGPGLGYYLILKRIRELEKTKNKYDFSFSWTIYKREWNSGIFRSTLPFSVIESFYVTY